MSEDALALAKWTPPREATDAGAVERAGYGCSSRARANGVARSTSSASNEIEEDERVPAVEQWRPRPPTDSSRRARPVRARADAPAGTPGSRCSGAASRSLSWATRPAICAASRGTSRRALENDAYDLKSVKLPRLAGKSLKAFVRLLDSRLRFVASDPQTYERCSRNSTQRAGNR